MPIQNGKYVPPTGGWVNGTSPYINASELNAISNTLALVPIANGGTGKTTASEALAALGGIPLANIKSKGSATNPVYFDADGVAQPMSGALPISRGGTGATEIKTLALSDGITLKKWGNLVCCNMIGTQKTAGFYYDGFIPAEYRPAAPAYFLVPATASTSAVGGVISATRVVVSTGGKLNVTVADGDPDGYVRFTVWWFTA